MKTRHLLILMTAAVAMFMVTLAPAAKMCPNTSQQQISTTFDAMAQTAQISQTAMNDTGQTSMVVAKETEPACAQEDVLTAVNVEANKKADSANVVARIICPMKANQNGSIRGA